jgi:bZIP transcription factor
MNRDFTTFGWPDDGGDGCYAMPPPLALDELPALTPTPPPLGPAASSFTPVFPAVLLAYHDRPASPYASWCSAAPGCASAHVTGAIQETQQPRSMKENNNITINNNNTRDETYTDRTDCNKNPAVQTSPAASPDSPARSVNFPPLRGAVARPAGTRSRSRPSRRVKVPTPATAIVTAAATDAAEPAPSPHPTDAFFVKEEDHVDEAANDGLLTDGDDESYADLDMLDLSGTTAARSRKMTEKEREVMLFKRRLRNRQSAARSREKQRTQVNVLGAEVVKLNQIVANLHSEVARLRTENSLLKSPGSKLSSFL